jgi:hypothetical protein
MFVICVFRVRRVCRRNGGDLFWGIGRVSVSVSGMLLRER